MPQHPLKPNLTQSRNNQLSKNDLIQACLYFLKFRQRSRQEISIFLEKKVDNLQLIQAVLDYLDENNLINDRELATWVAKSYLNKGKGPGLITQKLHKLGLDSNTIKIALTEIAPEALCEAAGNYLKKKAYKLNKAPIKTRHLKANQLLYQRGFDAKTRGAAIDEFIPRQ